MISARFSEWHADQTARRAGTKVNRSSGGARRGSGGIGVVSDVARTLLVLVLVGAGIVVLRLLLGLARGVIGH